jgi:hypothetical protein
LGEFVKLRPNGKGGVMGVWCICPQLAEIVGVCGGNLPTVSAPPGSESHANPFVTKP